MVIRVEKTKNYTTMSNYHFKDKDMSLKAKGLLSLILSLPEEWDYTLKGLSMLCRDGVDSVRTALKELREFGYVETTRVRDEKGRLRTCLKSINKYRNECQNSHLQRCM